jgi:hypothetical protein
MCFGIKLVLPEKPTQEEFNLVHQYLELPDHKIRILDWSAIGSNYFIDMIRLLNYPAVNYLSLDIVNFGYRTLHQKEFIFFGKWLLMRFSNKQESEHISIPKYLWFCRTRQMHDKTVPVNKRDRAKVRSDFNNSLDRRNNRKHFWRSNTMDMHKLDIIKSDDEEEKRKLEVSIFVTRKLRADDLKVIWLITQHWSRNLHFNIKAKEFENEVERSSSEEQNRSNCWKALMQVKKNVWGFHYLDEVEKNIKFHILIKLAYFSFLLNLSLWILLPVLLKHPDWGKGTLWISHILFAFYLILAFSAELLVFFLCFDKETRSHVFWDKRRKTSCFVVFAYTMVGIISKGDIYTDVAFLVEIGKWNSQGEGIYGPIILYVASIVFVFTVIYQLLLFIRLIFKSSTSTFWPLASHTTRLLIWADFKFLSVMVDKFSVTYYDNFFFWKVPTYKIIALFKLIFEDITQCVLQITYLITARKDDLSLYVIILSLCFSFPAIASSLFTLLYDNTSTISLENYRQMETKIKEDGVHNNSNLPFKRDAESNNVISLEESLSNQRYNFKLPPISKGRPNLLSQEESVSLEGDPRNLSTLDINENFEKAVKSAFLRTPEKPPRHPRTQFESPMVRANFVGDAQSNKFVPSLENNSMFRLQPVMEHEISDSEEDQMPLPKLPWKKYFSEWK